MIPPICGSWSSHIHRDRQTDARRLGPDEQGGVVVFNGERVSVWEDEKVVEIGCTTVQMCLTPQPVCLEMVVMVNCMLYVSYCSLEFFFFN